MKKSITSVLLTLLLLIQPVTAGAVSLEKVEGIENKINELLKNNIIQGDQNYNLNLDNNITRAEITATVIRMLNRQKMAESMQNQQGIFSDVTPSYWANGAINDASLEPLPNSQFIIKGFPDGTFRPSKEITYAELSKMLVVIKDKNLIRADIENYNKNWPSDWVMKAEKLGINEDIEITDPNTELTRKEAFTMCYNAMNIDDSTSDSSEKGNIDNISSIINKGSGLNLDIDKINREIDRNVQQARDAKDKLMDSIDRIREGKEEIDKFRDEMEEASEKIKLDKEDLQEIIDKIDDLKKEAGENINIKLDELKDIQDAIRDILTTEKEITDEDMQKIKDLLDKLKNN